MEAKELIGILKGISRELPSAIQQKKAEERLMHAIMHVAEYLEYEQIARKTSQRKTEDTAEQVEVNTKKLEQHDKLLYGERTELEEKPGMALELIAIRKGFKRMNGILWSIFVLILSAFVMRILQLMGFQLK